MEQRGVIAKRTVNNARRIISVITLEKCKGIFDQIKIFIKAFVCK
jgi:hypothetical protein